MTTCNIPGCDRPVYGHGFCSAHWQRWRTHGTPSADIPIKSPPPLICIINGCENPPYAHGWCAAHYARWKRNGNLIVDRPIGLPGRPIGESENRFWSHVEKTSTCWLWAGFIKPNGYAQFSIGTQHREGIHRYAYQLFYGEIAPGNHIDHLCKIRHCVNPEHLEQVPPRVNNERSNSPSAQNILKTHCPQGHPYDETNTYINQRGGRHCKKCLLLNKQARRLRLKLEGVH